MTDMVPSRIGQVNSSGDAKSLFLIQFGGEVMVAFEKATVGLQHSVVRNITGGKSAKFPATGVAAASYHTPGALITGQTINGNERILEVDDMLIAPVFIPNIDEAMNHFEYRGIYSSECGKVLAYMMDKNILQTGVLAARAAATVSGGNGGSQLTNANYKVDSSTLASGLYAAAQKFDEKAVDDQGRFCFVLPAQYYLLAQNVSLINKDWGGMGSYADGDIVKIAGIQLVKTLHLPVTNINTGPAKYQVDATNTAALIMTDKAVGTVKLIGVSTESEYKLEYQGTLIVSKTAVGHGILRPECAIELKTA